MTNNNNQTILITFGFLIIALVLIGGFFLYSEIDEIKQNLPQLEQIEEINNSKVASGIEEITEDQNSTDQETETTLTKLNNLASTFTVVDPENYSYKGCAMIHGSDGNIGNWASYDANYQQKLYDFLEASASKYQVIKLDYSKNPYNTNDRIQIVTCNCADYYSALSEIEANGLYFQDLLWHSIDDRENDPMISCMKKLTFR